MRRVFFGQHSNSCSQWVSWLSLHKYGELQHSLAFTSYNRSWSYGSEPASNSALFLQSSKPANLVNCSFHDNLGTALTVHDTSITLAENKFTHNQCGCELFSYDCKLGCGITALNSNLTFTGNTTFHESNASYYDDTGHQQVH